MRQRCGRSAIIIIINMILKTTVIFLVIILRSYFLSLSVYNIFFCITAAVCYFSALYPIGQAKSVVHTMFFFISYTFKQEPSKTYE